MLVLVSGGSASGKSEYAEQLILQGPPGPRVYVATMLVRDDEGKRRVARHHALRAGKGFSTAEQPLNLHTLCPSPNASVLVEDLSNLTANEWFETPSSSGAFTRVMDGIAHLQASAALTVVVTNELFSDGVEYDGETAAYLRCLAALNRAIAARADVVYEVVCGLPVCWKGGT